MRSKTVLKLSLILSGLVIAAEAQAISHYNSALSSCSAIQAAIQSEGEVVLHWTQAPDIQRYVRAVSGGASCAGGEEAIPVSVPSSGGPCSVLVCRPIPASDQPTTDTNHVCTTS